MNSVQFDPDAREEFIDAVRYYEDCQKGLGLRFHLTVQSSIKKISENPLMFRVLKTPFRAFLLPEFPYMIIYSIEPDHIRIIALAHCKRKPGYWNKRTK